MQVNLNAPINVATSYGITGINLIQSLTKLGHTVNAFPIGGVSYYPEQAEIPLAIQNGETGCHRSEKSVRLYHQFALYEHISDYHIGFPIFELDCFSEKELASLTSCDELIVCSEWAKSVFNQYDFIKYSKISVVPLGVDRTIFKPLEIGEKDEPFTFFFPGKFEYRKGFDIVMDVFDKAFPTEDIQLFFLPQNLFIKDNDDWANSLMNSNLGKRRCVKVLGRMERPEQVANLVNYSDAVVSFSRAEGWNLPLLEALSCGKPVLATNYSGHTEFLNSTNSLLVDIEGREPAIDGVFFEGQGNWLSYSESDIDNFVSGLQQLYKDGRKLNTQGLETAKLFSWENSARKLVEAIS